MIVQKKKLVLCLLSIVCVVLLCLTAAWYAFCLKHVHLPDTLEIPDEVLQRRLQEKYRNIKGLGIYLIIFHRMKL